MARKYSTSKSSRYSKKGRKTSKAPRRALKKSKPTKKITRRTMLKYEQQLAIKRGVLEDEE